MASLHNPHKHTITKIPDELCDEIVTVLPKEKPENAVGRPITPFGKAMDGIMYIIRNQMPVENAAQRIWFRFHLPQAVSEMGQASCFQKDVGQAAKNIW